MNGRPTIYCVGETMAMVTPEDLVGLERAREFRVLVGGAESTVALYLAEAGHDVAWLSRLGSDPLGRRIERYLRGAGVVTDAVAFLDDAPTGVYFKDPGPDGTRVHYYRAGSAASTMDGTDADRIPDGARHIHLTGITPALSSSCRALVHRIADRFSSTACTISFDVNHRPGLWGREVAAPTLLALARRADVVFVGLDEAHHLWGTATAEDVADLLATVVVSGRLVVKDGGVGAHEFGPGGTTFAPALPATVVEPVGAGDAFAAGYLVGLLAGEGAPGRLASGHRFAARALSGFGDFVPQRTRPEEVRA